MSLLRFLNLINCTYVTKIGQNQNGNTDNLIIETLNFQYLSTMLAIFV